MAAVSHVSTIERVAKILGEDADWLSEISDEMDPEGGRLWIVGEDDDYALAFTVAGIETLAGIVREYRANPALTPRPP